MAIVGKSKFVEDCIFTGILRWVNGRTDCSEFAFQVPQHAVGKRIVRRLQQSQDWDREIEDISLNVYRGNLHNEIEVVVAD